MNPQQHEPNDATSQRADRRGGRRWGARPTPAGLEQRLLARAQQAGFVHGDRLVVAFSGGRDSLALAAGLGRARDVHGVRLLLVHVDHRLRAESAEDAAKAADLAAALDIECLVLAVPAVPTEIHPGVGMEEAARRERYRLLFKAADDAGARAVATGHHELDQAETVLLHLLRGGGVQGAAGMGERTGGPIVGPPPNDISPEQSRPWLWRPLLQEARSEIEAYVAQLGLRWVEDSSNTDLGPRRNVVRHQIIPLLEAEFPGAAAALARYASLAAADDEALEQIVQSALAGEVDPGGRLRADALGGRPLAVQRRMIRRWFGDCTGSRALTAQRTDAILDLGSSGRGNRTIEAGRGWSVSLLEGMLRARRDTDEKEAE